MDAGGIRMVAKAVRFGCVVIAAVVGLALSASPALAAGTLTVDVVGNGHVTSSDGNIDCTQAGESTCSHVYTDRTFCPPGGGQCITVSDSVTLDESPADGFTFSSWGGCQPTDTSCTVYMAAPHAVTATFRDVQAPTVTLTKPADGAVVGGNLELAADAADNGSVDHVTFHVGTLPYTDNTAPYGTGTGRFNTSGLPDGPTSVTATAVDEAGLAKISPPHTITIDHTPPTLSLEGPNGQTFGPSDTESWTFSAQDATSGVANVRCSVVASGQAGSFSPCSGANTSHSVSGLPEGEYRFSVIVTDNAGNTSSWTRTFSIDATAPETTITGGPADGSSQVSGTATFTFATDDSGAHFQCRVYANGTTAPAFEPCTDATSETISGLGLGTYRLDVRAVDAVGNADQSPESRSFSVVAPTTPAEPDPTPTTPTTPTTTLPGPASAPDTTIDVHPNRKVRKRRAKFAFSSSDSSATFECSLDGAGFVPCASPYSVKVKPGKHVFAVRAVGASALRDATPASWRWKVKRKRHHHHHHGH
jgi:hypothetical protein